MREYCEEEIIDSMIDVKKMMLYFDCGKNIAYRILHKCDHLKKYKNKIMVSLDDFIDFVERLYGMQLIYFWEDERMYIHEAYGDFITVQQTAGILDLTKSKVYELIEAGTIDAVMLGKKWIIPAYMLDHQLESGIDFRKEN